MQCNIDARGKAVRLKTGFAAAVIGLLLIVLEQVGILDVAWQYVGIGLIAIGGFGIFEGWKGWCAMRALGFRTRL